MIWHKIFQNSAHIKKNLYRWWIPRFTILHSRVTRGRSHPILYLSLRVCSRTSGSFARFFGNLRCFKKLCNFIFSVNVSTCGVVAKLFDFQPAVPGSILVVGNFFKKSQIFLTTRGFQKFWQKTWNQQLLFYYTMRRGENRIVASSSDSS